MREDAKYDVIVYGASGYTGRLVAEYLQANYGDSISWAIAGRNEEKLKKLRQELGASEACAIFTADCEDSTALATMAQQAKCVLSTVGPYQLYGRKLIDVCVDTNTDYVDLCGEPNFMAEVIASQHEKARASGARIVFSCGFDSIPFDLGVQYLIYEAHKTIGHGQGQGPFVGIGARVLGLKGTFSGGTAASMQATMSALTKNPELQDILTNPFALTTEKKGAPQPGMQEPRADLSIPNAWLAPFVMAPINSKNVHRSNELMGYPYGKNFQYDEMTLAGFGEAGKAQAEVAQNPFGSDLPKPGEGPSKAEREAGFYKILFTGYVEQAGARAYKNRMAALVSGDMDPGYGSTSKMVAESALCLVERCWGLDGGIWTPASSMGITLRFQLEQKAGLTFKNVGGKLDKNHEVFRNLGNS